VLKTRNQISRPAATHPIIRAYPHTFIAYRVIHAQTAYELVGKGVQVHRGQARSQRARLPQQVVDVLLLRVLHGRLPRPPARKELTPDRTCAGPFHRLRMAVRRARLQRRCDRGIRDEEPAAGTKTLGSRRARCTRCAPEAVVARGPCHQRPVSPRCLRAPERLTSRFPLQGRTSPRWARRRPGKRTEG
jgi:hypothetical protein